MYGKYHLYKKQLSWDSGVTWYDTDPLETVISGTPVATYETLEECTGGTPPSFKYKLTLNDSSTVSAECDSTSAITRNETSAYSASVTSAIIGDCVTELSSTSYGNGVFQGCTALTSVTLGDSITTLGSFTFRDCTGLTSVTIPDSVTTISNNVFDTCTSLTGITIPTGVTTINMSTFYGCSSLTSIVIPDNITSIGWGAFQNCSGLTSITVNATTPPTMTSAFDNTNNCPIYVPSGSVNAYKSASGWSNYASRIQAIP